MSKIKTAASVTIAAAEAFVGKISSCVALPYVRVVVQRVCFGCFGYRGRRSDRGVTSLD